MHDTARELKSFVAREDKFLASKSFKRQQDVIERIDLISAGLITFENNREVKFLHDDSAENTLVSPPIQLVFRKNGGNRRVWLSFTPNFMPAEKKFSLSEIARADPITMRVQRIKVRSNCPI